MWDLVAFFSILLTSVLTFEDKDMICTSDLCTKYIEEKGCPELSEACVAQNSTHNGVRLPYPDTCNCCDYCITNLREGETCISGSPGMLPPLTICGPGLACQGHPPTCQPMKTACTNEQKDWDDRRANGTLGMTEVRPNCDEDGMFLSSHCTPGFACYCLSPEGQRIFGEKPFLEPSDVDKMTCGCSVNHWKALGSVNSDFSDVVLAARCNDYGLYDPLQCMMGIDGDCYCVDPITGDPLEDIDPVPISKLKPGNPICFDPSIHVFSGTYDSECEIMQTKWLRRSNNKMASSLRSDAFVSPKCQPDGKFSRVQTLGNKQICVDPDGQQIDRFEISIDLIDANATDCNCARMLWLLRSAGVTELPICDTRGNFQPRQSRRNEYFCVDCNGDQIGVEKDTSDEAEGGEISCSYVSEPCEGSLRSLFDE